MNFDGGGFFPSLKFSGKKLVSINSNTPFYLFFLPNYKVKLLYSRHQQDKKVSFIEISVRHEQALQFSTDLRPIIPNVSTSVSQSVESHCFTEGGGSFPSLKSSGKKSKTINSNMPFSLSLFFQIIK